MDPEIAFVMSGYLNLTQAQRSDFVDYLNSYNRGNQAERDGITRESVRKSVRKLDVGPVGSGVCPCCHR